MAGAYSHMEEEIRTILKIKDYYKVLGVDRDADESAIKTAYKKLALKFHPDKNKCQGAREAFNKVSTAYTTLVDKDKRTHYDRFGSAEDIMREQANRQQQFYHQQAGYNDHFDEFDFIFRQFFGGMQAYGRFYNQRPHQAQNYQRRQQANAGPQLNIFHFIILATFAMTFLPKFFESKPYYSFLPSYEYSHQRQTQVLKVPFFVRSEYFDYINNHDLRKNQINKQVEAQYLRQLNSECEEQKYLRRRYTQLAQQGSYFANHYNNLANSIDLTSCKILQQHQQNNQQYLNNFF